MTHQHGNTGGKTLLILGIAAGALLSGVVTTAAWGLQYQKIDAIGTATLVFLTGLVFGSVIALRIMIKLSRFTKLDASVEKGTAIGSMDSYRDALFLVKKYDKESCIDQLEKRFDHWSEMSQKYVENWIDGDKRDGGET